MIYTSLKHIVLLKKLYISLVGNVYEIISSSQALFLYKKMVFILKYGLPGWLRR